jgi:hypothetical protein
VRVGWLVLGWLVMKTAALKAALVRMRGCWWCQLSIVGAMHQYRSVVILQNWPLSGVCVWWRRYAGSKKERANVTLRGRPWPSLPGSSRLVKRRSGGRPVVQGTKTWRGPRDDW